MSRDDARNGAGAAGNADEPATTEFTAMPEYPEYVVEWHAPDPADPGDPGDPPDPGDPADPPEPAGRADTAVLDIWSDARDTAYDSTYDETAYEATGYHETAADDQLTADESADSADAAPGDGGEVVPPPVATGPDRRRARGPGTGAGLVTLTREWSAAVGSRGAVPVRRYVAVVVAYAVLQGLCLLLLAPVVESVLRERYGEASRWLAFLTVGAVAAGVAYYLQAQWGAGLPGRVGQALRTRVGQHLDGVPPGWFVDQRRRGVRVADALGTDVDVVADAPTRLLRPALVGTLTPAVVVIGLFALDWRMALVALAAMLVVAAVYAWTASVTTGDRRSDVDRTDDVAGRLLTFAAEQPALRAAAEPPAGSARSAGPAETGAPDPTAHATLRASVAGASDTVNDALRRQADADHAGLAASLFGRAGPAAAHLALTLALVVGAALALAGPAAIPELVAVVALVVRVGEPVALAPAYAESVHRTSRALGAVRALLAAPRRPEPELPTQPAPDGTVELVDVRFDVDGVPVFDDLELRLAPRTVTALVGSPGAGKTTVARLIARYWDVDAGSVRVGGVDVRSMTAEALVAQVAQVDADGPLVDGTIEDNVRVARPDATPDELTDAARLARLDLVVDPLPGGWSTPVGAGSGVVLSTGERQRIALARAILAGAPIVLLDEVTAARDPENEAVVADALDVLAGSRTVLVLAHRLSTIARADTIAVLDSGRVVESGSHDDLLARDGRYTAFWRSRNEAQGWQLTSTARR